MRSLLGVAVVLLLASSPLVAFVPPAYDDAPIRAIRFVDKDQGVAVGDHGVVWVTLNGGKTWDRMKSGTKASLRAVCFAGPFHGWAVGRTELGVGSAGVVLATADGGLTWAEVNATSLPGLNVVQFFNESNGIAAGDGTPGNPGGVFVTSDGGKNWVALSGPPATSWTCGQFENMSTGTLGGVWGKLAVCEKGIQKPAAADMLAGRAVRGLAFDGPNGVAACDTGMILTTADGGKTWAACDTGLPAAVSQSVDFRCVARSGNTVWVGGKPGSVVLKSTDGGKTWATCRTGWNLPLNSLCATSATDVWAAGEFGTILKSSDGGKTWTVQKCGGQRAAVLFANASGTDVPMDAVVMLGGKDGYLSAAVAVTAADPGSADPKHMQDEFRLQSAMRLAGGTAADCLRTFPVPTHLGDCKPADLFALWNAPDGDRLVRELVLAVRMWGPDVIVSDLLSASASPAEQAVLAAVQKAFKLAEDTTAYPEQIEALGLKPVAAKKLYAVAPEPSKDAPVKHDNTLFAKTLFNTPQGYAEPACAALGEGITPPGRRSFRLVSHRVPGCEGHAEMTVGLDLAEGGSARRKLPAFDPTLDELFKTAEGYFGQRRTIEGLVLSGNSTAGVERAMAMAAGSLRKLPDDLACRTAVALGRQMAAEGRWVAARELFLIAADRYADFPEAAEAVRWLGRYYASSEARTRAAKENAVVLQYSLIAPKGGAVKQAAHVEAVTKNNQSMRLTDGEATQAWCRACLEMDGKRKGFGPAYTHDPAMAVLTASARRQLGLTQDAVKGVSAYFAANAGMRDMAPGANLWRDCLATELWLADRTAVPVQPKPFALCPKVANKPFLDGKLDDDCWKGQKPIEARTARGELTGYSTKAYFAFDDEYLYFAVECSHPDGKALPKAEQRRRDDDLRGKDRVDILLDLDRDYQTYYRLQVDQRGCVAEDCWGDATWNPKWFVAVEPTPTGWTAEIAIPRAELAGGAFKPGTTWGMNVTRVVPGMGCQTWSGPAADTPRPEGMGLMQLHDEKK